MQDQVRRVDCHVHMWRVDRGDYFWMTEEVAPLLRDFGPGDLAPLLATASIGEAVVVQAAPTTAETRYILDLAASTSFVTGVVGWVDMEDPRALADLECLAANFLFKGIRPMIQDIPDPDWVMRDALAGAFDALASLGLTFEWLVHPRHLPQVIDIHHRHHRLRAVIDHGAKPAIAVDGFRNWAGDIRRVAEETDVYCKISGLVTEAGRDWNTDRLRPYVDHLLECFGPRRLMFGSDWPVVTLVADYDAWYRTACDLLAGLSAEDRDLVFGANAAAFYRL